MDSSGAVATRAPGLMPKAPEAGLFFRLVHIKYRSFPQLVPRLFAKGP
jgi:hypothetical protein